MSASPPTSPEPTPPSSHHEAKRALVDFYQEQSDRAERVKQARRRRGPRVPATAVVAVLAVFSGWLWLAPPGWLVPAPLPPPSPRVIEVGLRMDVYTAALAIQGYVETHGILPPDLTVLEPPAAEDVIYTRMGRLQYRLSGRRGETRLSWDSSQPMSVLLTDVPQGLLGEGVR